MERRQHQRTTQDPALSSSCLHLSSQTPLASSTSHFLPSFLFFVPFYLYFSLPPHSQAPPPPLAGLGRSGGKGWSAQAGAGPRPGWGSWRARPVPTRSRQPGHPFATLRSLHLPREGGAVPRAVPGRCPWSGGGSPSARQGCGCGSRPSGCWGRGAAGDGWRGERLRDS